MTTNVPTQQQENTKIKITERALYQRINRRLKRDGERLQTARSQSTELSVGRYYIVNGDGNYILHQHVDLEAWGREFGVIQPWEQLEEQ
jgi:hypothetical protein